MTSIDLEELDIGQLAGLLGEAQAEMAAREKGNRKDLRSELERRVAAEGYQLADILPELGIASPGRARRKRPPKYRDPQNPEQSWSGVGRVPNAGAGYPRRARSQSRRFQVHPDVPDPSLGLSHVERAPGVVEPIRENRVRGECFHSARVLGNGMGRPLPQRGNATKQP